MSAGGQGGRGGRRREALKVGISGVRGVVGASFTPQVAVAFAQAFGSFVGRGPVLVGRDTRRSGAMFEEAVSAGLRSVGCQPVLAGVLPTPSLLVQTLGLRARGGIVITASHNPAPWNALKFVNRRGLFLSPVEAEELFDLYHQQDVELVGEDALPGVRRLEDPVRPHLDRVEAYVDAARIRARRARVAVDACNGVGALYSAAFLRDRMGCEVHVVHGRADGRFEREPEPLPEHLGALCRAVRGERCDVGFAQDPDGDRLALVDEQGRPLGEDLTLALAVRQVLSAHARGPVVANLCTSRVVEAAAAPFGAPVERTRIGEIHVSERMLAVGAVVGGENNGGVIVPAVHPCRDSFVGMALVLELMASTGLALSALRDELPRFAVTKRKVPVSAADAPAMLRAVRRAYAGRPVNLDDGVFIDFGDRWAHARRSNTEPILRVVVEAPGAEAADALAEEVIAVLEGARPGS